MADDSLVTTPPIKQEPEDSSLAPKFAPGEIIDLISDNEEDVPPAASRPQLGSPFLGRHSDQAPDPLPLNLGPSVLSEPKKAAPKKMTVKERMREVARNTAQQFREEPAQNAQHTPVRFGRSELFVTESDPGTPDAAQQFLEYKQAIDDKRRKNTLSVEEDIKFRRAKAEEEVRVLQERANIDYERSPSPVEDEDLSLADPALTVPGLESAEDEPTAPKKGGRKRKAPAGSQSQPKKRGRQAKDAKADAKAEDILQKARRKLEQKGKGKGKGKGKAAAKAKPTAKGKSASERYKGPELMNADSLQRTNIFEDAALIDSRSDQPTYEPTAKKKEAFKQLIANMSGEDLRHAQTDKVALDKALKSFTGQGSCHPGKDGRWDLKGLKVSLHAYQVLGVAFLRRREVSAIQPRGGIVADQMGLGKTVTMLANIINGKSLATSKCHTTLIVASNALISQWKREIKDKLYTRHEDKKHGIGRVKVYQASDLLEGNEEQQELLECDIVLTTNTQVNKSFPKANIPPEFTTADQRLQWWKKYYEENKGILHRIKFLRVVLDEAQAIKNPVSLTSRACSALEAVHYWSMSGTIILNNLNEFYGQFRFLRVPFTGSYRIFKENFTSPDDPDGMTKLKHVLSQFLLRRTHADTLFNAKLLSLPTPHQDIQWVTFNSVERAVYDIVKARFVAKINCMAKAGPGELDRQYNMIWAMLLRLRQLCSHILLIQGTMVDLLEREDFERLREISSEDLNEESEALLAHLQQKMRNNTSVKEFEATDGNIVLTESETVPMHQIDVNTGNADLGGSHGLSYNFGRYLQSLQESEAFEAICERTLCCGCRQPPQDPQVTSCFHIYCHTCLMDLQSSFARRGLERHRCTECGVFYDDAKPCEKILEPYVGANENMAISDQEGGLGLRKGGQKDKGKAEQNDWIQMRGQILPSAKTIALKARIMAWIEEDEDVKILVFSQFIPMLRILLKVCKTEKWEAELYTGAMSHDSRERALQRFGNPKGKVRILLASLKCGGIGLNLTMASRVITLDPWWNASIEEQAFCRVYRIGQQKETQFARLVVKNTIDEAIIALQRSKQITIDAALDDSKRKEKVNTKELIGLFGRVVQDKHGKPFVFAHEDDDENADRVPPPPAERESDDEGDGMRSDD